MTFIFHPAFIQHTSYCAKAKPCPAHARASGLEPSGSALRTAAHAIKALCLYCVTGDEPSPDVLTRLLESNRKSIRIPLPRGTGDPLHAVFEIVQQLALQGYPVPLDLLPLRKSFLTLDGITRRLDPDFKCPGGNPRVCLRGVRKRSRRANLDHSIPMARPARFLSFRAAHANARGSCRGHDPKNVCADAKTCWRVSEILAMFCSEAFERAPTRDEPPALIQTWMWAFTTPKIRHPTSKRFAVSPKQSRRQIPPNRSGLLQVGTLGQRRRVDSNTNGKTGPF